MSPVKSSLNVIYGYLETRNDIYNKTNYMYPRLIDINELSSYGIFLATKTSLNF